MCAVARGECYFKSNEEDYMEGRECYIKKITKENVIKDIKQKCFGYLPTKMQESWWEEYDIYDKKGECALIEAERIIKEASTFKAPQNILSRGFYKKLEEIAKDIHKDIQKPYVFWDDNPELFMKNHKAATAKYANTPITQAMINPLKTLAQQKAQPLEKLLTQRDEIKSQKKAFAKQELQSRIDTLKARKKEIEARSNKIPYDSKEKKEIDEEIIGIDMELRDAMTWVRMGNTGMGFYGITTPPRIRYTNKRTKHTNRAKRIGIFSFSSRDSFPRNAKRSAKRNPKSRENEPSTTHTICHPAFRM